MPVMIHEGSIILAMKCPCGKTGFVERWQAELAAIKVALEYKETQVPYWSPDCRCYHVTSQCWSKGRKTAALARKIEVYRT